MIDREVDFSALSPEKSTLVELLLGEAARADSPANRVESDLCNLWSEAFGQAVGPRDDFFQLGGDSILAVRLAARAHALGHAFSGAKIFTHPTIRELAQEVVLAVGPGATPSLAADRRDGADVRLTPMQQGMLYQTELAGRGDAYQSQFLCRFPAELDLPRFIEAWRKVARHRCALRSALAHRDDGSPVLRVAAEVPLNVAVYDWRQWKAEDAEGAIHTLAEADRIRGFDLARAPLSRLIMTRMPDGTWRCLWGHHHLVLDGWSQLVLLDEVFAIYRGEAVELRDDFPAIAAFARAQRTTLTAEAAAFWRDRLGAVVSCSFSPVAAADELRGVESAVATLDPDVVQSLSRTATHASTSLAMAIELIWATVVAGLFGCDNPVFGQVVAVRPPGAAAERLAWLCINTALQGFDLASGGGIAAHLAAGAASRASWQERASDPLNEVMKICPDARFGSVLVIENFDSGTSPGWNIDVSARPSDVIFQVREHHPLVCVVSGRDARLAVEIKVDQNWRVPLSAPDLAAAFVTAASAMAANPDQSLRQIARAMRNRTATAARAADWSRLKPGGSRHE